MTADPAHDDRTPTAAESNSAAVAVRAFADRQARPHSLGVGDGAVEPRPVPVEVRSTVVPLAHDLGAVLDEIPATERGAGIQDPWRQLELVLHGAFGVQRWEPTHPYNGHRAFPSPRCAFPTNAFVIDAEGGAWWFDPGGHELRGVGDRRTEAHGLPELVRASGGATIAVAADQGALPAPYGELRYPLSALEAGHAVATCGLVARAVGASPVVRCSFDDAALLRRLGLDVDDGWLPMALVELGATGLSTSSGPAVHEIAPLAARPDSFGWLRGGEVEAWPGDDVASGTGGVEHVRVVGRDRDRSVALPPRSGRDGPSLGRLLYERSAGRARTGASGMPAPLPGESFRAMLDSVAQPLDLGIRPRPWGTEARCLVVVENTVGLADGVYEWRPPELLRLSDGPALARVQATFAYSPEWVRVDTFNHAWCFVLDHARVIDRLGPRGFRVAQLELGSIAQSLGLAATAEGAFARPCRSYDHDGLADLLDLDEHETVAYEVLVGRDRFHDLLLDVRP